MTNVTDQIREWFRRMERGSSAQCAAALGIKNANCYRRIRELLKRGWLTQPCYGVFQYQEIPEHLRGKAVELQAKMWRAVRIAGLATVWDIAQFSGASYEYAQAYMRFLKAENLIKETRERDRMRPKYRCLAQLRQETPVMRAHKTRTAAELRRLKFMDTGWALMRALRDGDDAAAREVLKGLSQEFSAGKPGTVPGVKEEIK